MKKSILFLTLLLVTTISYSHDIKNAKIGSTVVNSYGVLTPFIGQTSIEGHAGVVIDEYVNDEQPKFIVGAHLMTVKYDSYDDHLNGHYHLGHFRAVSRNYTFKERDKIVIAAKNAVGKYYTFFNLYVYFNDYDHINNIPYNQETIPTFFRCDGLAEWATEVGMKPANANANESDGFYSSNTKPLYNILEPIDIVEQSPVDVIGTPDKPELLLIDNQVDIKFPLVSGAWLNALYSVYRSESNNVSTGSDPIYCGKNKSYTDIITDDMEGKYYYFLKIGERTASCDTMFDFSEFSESSSIELDKICKSPELFEVVSQTKPNTSDWRVSVKNIETDEIQEDVYPFNLEGNGSLYQLESGKWVLANCEGTTISETWEGKQSDELYQIDNPEKETIVGENLCKSPELFEIVSQSANNTIDWRVSVKNKETNETQENVYPFNLSGSLYQLESGEWVIASCGGTRISREWLGQQENEFYVIDNPEWEIIKTISTNKFYMKYIWHIDEYSYLSLALQQYQDKEFTIPLSITFFGGARLSEQQIIQAQISNKFTWESGAFFGIHIDNILQNNSKSLNDIERLRYIIIKTKLSDPDAQYYSYYVEFEVIFK